MEKPKRVHYNLLGVGNDAKTPKGEQYGVLTAILYLSPAKEADGVHDLCPYRTAGCTMCCLHKSGMAQAYESINLHRRMKTLLYLADYAAFCRILAKDIAKLEAEARSRGLVPAVRLNGTSDQPKLARRLAKQFPAVQFYDYTKIPRPWVRTLPNYHLTFSYSGENLKAAMAAMAHGINVSVVFDHSAPMPKTWRGFRVIDGDQSDLRFRDPVGVIVGLTVKDNAATRQGPNEFIQIAGVAA